MMLSLLLAAGLFQTGSENASSDATAEVFVRRLYQMEAHETKAAEDAFAGHRGAAAVYSPSLLALIRLDIARTSRGDVGKLDYDPICGCQDSDGIAVEKLQLIPVDQSAAKALVTLNFGSNEHHELTLKLLRTQHGWRVDDVDGPTGFKPLRKLLTSK